MNAYTLKRRQLEVLRATKRRNAEILKRIRAGETQTALAREYQLTRQRVSQIVAASGRSLQ